MQTSTLRKIGLCFGCSVMSLGVLVLIVAGNGGLASAENSTSLTLYPAPSPALQQAIDAWRKEVASRNNKKKTSSKKTASSARREKAIKLAKERLLASTTTTTTVTETVNAASQLLPIVQQTSIRPNHQILADKVLRFLPATCRDNLKNFYVLYGNAERRGLGGKTTIILDGTVPDDEFVQLLTHECGHVIHSNMMGSAEFGTSAFRDGQAPFYSDSPIIVFFMINWQNETTKRPGVADADFVSGYSKENAFEQFAETFNAYMFHREWLRVRASTNTKIATELLWMEQNFPGTAYPAQDLATWTGEVPWDATKLAIAL